MGTAAASLYVYGYWTDNRDARDDAITGAEGAGLASLANLGFKYGFGRLRPNQDAHDHDAFFRGGQSMFSGEVTPVFGLAAGVSEYFDNRWYVSLPVYSLALLDGFGRMGHDAHWFSDVVGAALLGAGTTELFYGCVLLIREMRHSQKAVDSEMEFTLRLGALYQARHGLTPTWRW